VFLEARRIKTPDEISLLTQAWRDGRRAYEELYRFLRPGVRENECVGLVSKVLYDLGRRVRRGGQRDLRGALLAAPARLQRPAAAPGPTRHSSTSCTATSGTAPATTAASRVGSASAAQRDAYTRCREYMDRAIALVKPGATHGRHRRGVADRQEFGFADEEAAFAMQYGHGVGLSIWEKPIFSRLVSLEHPETLQEGMVFALETYWPATDGWSAARIEEEVVVTADGVRGHHQVPGRGPAGRRPPVLDGGRSAADPAGGRSRSLKPEAGRDGRRG